MKRRQQRPKRERVCTRLRIEQLENRRVLAIAIAVAGTEVNFVGDELGYNVELSADGLGRLQHNVMDDALNSLVDLDPTLPGDQTLLASAVTLISINLSAAGGSGVLTGIDSGQVVFVGGSLHFDWQAFTANSITVFTAGGFTRASGASQLTASVSNGNELTILYGEGADTILAAAFAGSITPRSGSERGLRVPHGRGQDYRATHLGGRQMPRRRPAGYLSALRRCQQFNEPAQAGATQRQLTAPCTTPWCEPASSW